MPEGAHAFSMAQELCCAAPALRCAVGECLAGPSHPARCGQVNSRSCPSVSETIPVLTCMPWCGRETGSGPWACLCRPSVTARPQTGARASSCSSTAWCARPAWTCLRRQLRVIGVAQNPSGCAMPCPSITGMTRGSACTPGRQACNRASLLSCPASVPAPTSPPPQHVCG